MYKYKKSVEKHRLLLSFMFLIYFLGLFLSLCLSQPSTLQLKNKSKKMEVEQDV